jgi:hypothetical protein
MTGRRAFSLSCSQEGYQPAKVANHLACDAAMQATAARFPIQAACKPAPSAARSLCNSLCCFSIAVFRCRSFTWP